MNVKRILELSTLPILVLLIVVSGVAQKKSSVKPSKRTTEKHAKVDNPNIDDTIEFLKGKLKSQMYYRDGKENTSCPNYIIKKVNYEEISFSSSTLDIKLKDEEIRTACMRSLVKDGNVSSTSNQYEDKKVSIPLSKLNVSGVKHGNCTSDKGYTRQEGSCYFVSVTAFNNKEIIDVIRINSFWLDNEKLTDKKLTSYKTSQFQIYLSDSETAERVSKALTHAIKLAGGKDEAF